MSHQSVISVATGKSAGCGLAVLFLSALVLRWGYGIGMYLLMGDAGLTGVDSGNYLEHTSAFLNDVDNGAVHGWLWLGTDPFIMPLVTYLVAINMIVFKSLAPLTYVMCQGVLDAGTCLFTYGLAREFNRNIAMPAGIAAAINPTQIVLSGLVYTDTAFLFFVAMFLYGAACWLRHAQRRYAVLIGVGMACAVLTRTVVALWVILMMGFLLLIAVFRWRARLKPVAGIAVATALFAMAAGTISLRNFTLYGSWSLTPQTGMHLNWWIAPLVKEASDGTPWRRTFEELVQKTRDRFGPHSENPFVESRRATEIATEELKRLGPAAIAKAWLLGGAINLGSPAVILSPPVSQLPRTGFYATPGETPLAKLANFIFRSDNARYAWILAIGIAGVAAIRLFQLFGFFVLVRQPGTRTILLLCAGWCLYILAVNGPIASPKYRLPMEPFLNILTAVGMAAIYRRKSGDFA